MTEITTNINRAVQLLKSGEIVALPTETVYGLAGNALDSDAIEKIFSAKNRPQDNPLIVHVSNIEMARKLGLEVPELADKLAEQFWPGPLTMIFRRAVGGKSSISKKVNIIPMAISCGLDSVAIRIPASEIMQEIIKRCEFPIAAPSANLSGRPSPTKAQHVYNDLQGRIPLIIDGGECSVGIESTVILFDDGVRILRPGAVTPEMLSDFAKVIVDDKGSLLSPGTRHKHYSPKAEVFAVQSQSKKEFNKYAEKSQFVIANPDTRTLFAKLREFDEQGAEKIFIRLPEPTGIGLALYNRIIRAAEFKIVKV